MKILYLGNKLSKHGINKTTVETLGGLLSESGFEVVSYSSKKNILLRLLDMLYGILKHKDSNYILIDTYSTSAFWFAFISSQFARFLKIKYIPILHGGDLPNRLQKNPKLCKLIFANANRLVSPSGYLKFHFEQHGFSNVIHIPNSITISEYQFKERKFFSPKLIWVRAFAEIYNPKMAIDVLEKLKHKYSNATLTMIGPDKDGSLNSIKEYAKHLNLKVDFTGKLSKKEWTTLAQNFDVFINTTHFDNMPVSVLEAMALGLPVVSTNVGGLPYLIEHDKTGFLVDDNDILAMVSKIDQIISSPIQTNEVVSNARNFVQSADWENVKNKWINLLK
ncbi:glycosyltransferase family 4 protein [Flavobacterium urocaniciphilum]|uniref:Glycosyltransferase involved in cell wall bisynthesis n=1 Tax=Flavobacterium urocaniciphilum TaxID=1299341 RepID=A0A1H8YS56_9FLAO|nr:glycosyltransferase family 4 protein [Flavobacterium urocaniciphilum]SEP54959.1 Glycosyltransferase involved in cell wall bisynthesis [Flavobacterium urocaniciphilum]